MTIPRGYIPGQNDFPVITSVSGSISFDDENLQTTGTITCNGLISPDIKALLASHDYQYVYDCSMLLTSSNHKWSIVQVGDASVTCDAGEITMVDVATTGRIGYYKSGLNFQPKDIVIAKIRAKQTVPGVQFLFRMTENDPAAVYKSTLLYFNNGTIGFCGESIAIDTTVYHEYTVVKDAQNYVYLFIDEIFVSKVAYNSLSVGTASYATTYSLFGLGYPASTGGAGTLVCDFYKYSIIREGSKPLDGTSSKIVGGNLDVKNQAETSGMQVTSTKVLATGTNQNVELEANGTGEIVANSNFTGKAVEGAIQHKYSGLISSNYSVPNDIGFVLSQSVSGNIDIDLPDAATNFGRTIIVNTNSSLNQTTVTCVDVNDRFYYNGVITYTTITLAGFPKYVQLVAMNNNCWQVTSHYGATFS